MLRIIGILLFCTVSSISGAQEMLVPLVTGNNWHPTQNQKRSSSNVYYIIDTLSIPFADDFSLNHIKPLNLSDTDTAVTRYPWEKYHLDGQYIDTIRYMDDTTYTYILNMASQVIDSIPNTWMLVEKFSTVYNFPVDCTLIVWPNYIGYAQGTSLTTVPIKEDHLLLNVRDTMAVAADDPFYYYTDNDVLINNNYPIDPPTYGVATFDGLDDTGYPYNGLGDPNAHGVADYLTSKPIDLELTPADKVIFSFFYQPQGHGNEPDPEDSLVLQFYAPNVHKWYNAWGSPGMPYQSFQEVYISITDTIYLHKGFKFRFYNYATISGNLDHWNIDYIRLDKNRTTNDEIDDLSFQYLPASFLSTYSAVPWDHYQSVDMLGSAVDDMHNLSLSSKLATDAFEVYDDQGALVYTSPVVTNPTVGPSSLFQMTHSLTYAFPSMTGSSYFTIRHMCNTTPDVNRDNDTLSTTQAFDTYYSYDDGSAELAYALAGQYAKVAVEYNIGQQDTLKAVLIHFPYMMHNITTLSFKLMVWSDLDPENIIYTGTASFPAYSSMLNGFVRYELDTTLIVDNTFYIGYEQVLADKIYIGFDDNTNEQDKIWYNTTGTFYQTQFTGALMMRPDFGKAAHFPLGRTEHLNTGITFNIFPNPASGQCTVSGLPGGTQYRLLDLSGRLCKEGYLGDSSTPLELEGLAPGLYLMQAHTTAGQVLSHKLIISR